MFIIDVTCFVVGQRPSSLSLRLRQLAFSKILPDSPDFCELIVCYCILICSAVNLTGIRMTLVITS